MARTSARRLSRLSSMVTRTNSFSMRPLAASALRGYLGALFNLGFMSMRNRRRKTPPTLYWFCRLG